MRAAEFAMKLGKATKAGTGWLAKCPAHDDRHASLSIGESREGKVLVNCHAGCDPATVVENAGLTFADLAGDAVAWSDDETVYGYRDETGSLLYEVVRRRKNGQKSFGQRRVVGPDREWGLADVRRVLYRLPELIEADPEQTVFIVEGEKDVDALRARGFVATTNMGGAGKGKWRPEYGEHLAGRSVILLPDNDEVGREHMRAVAEALTPFAKSVRTVELPGLPAKGDVSDFLAAHPVEEFQRAILPPPAKSYLVDPDEAMDAVMDLWTKGVQPGVSLGWKNLDPFFTVRKREFTVVTGVPGHGKSSWLDAAVMRLSEYYGWKVALFSPENQPVERHQKELIERFTGEPFGRPGDTWRMDPVKVKGGAEFIKQYFRFIRNDGYSLEELTEAMEESIRWGADTIVLDPWNEIDHRIPNGMNETDYIDQGLRRLRRFSRTHDIHLFVVVHPTKLRKMENGEYPVPTLYDCHGSAHWRNKADNGISIWRDVNDEKNIIEVHVQKIRFREVGKPGMCELWYQWTSGRFFDRPSENQGVQA